MLTLAKEECTNLCDLYRCIPERLRQYLYNISSENLAEVRIRNGAALSLVYTDGIFYLTPRGKVTETCCNALLCTTADIRRGIELITDSSVYAFEEEIKNGYVTIPGGHRVGICGGAVTENGKICCIRSVQSLNYRFAREVIGSADCVMDKILDGGRVKNTIIVSPPMCGKTTMLRDIARQLSLMGKKVSVVDERDEIAALSGGVPSFDLGANCDVLSGVGKAEGMLMMLRSMSPEVIITDEMGGSEDFAAVREIKKRGVAVITTLHGTQTDAGEFETVIRLDGIGKCLN
ncbi:MAG: stage III sporulation protein AA [Firmicutes bacterium]|nr:stage III sporulation protein AA [Bacillota bacterium]